jgi:hypothetical protein
MKQSPDIEGRAMISISAVAMSPGSRATLVVVGGIGALYCLAFALDFRGLASSQLMFFWRNWGRWLWPWGDERSYVTFNRLGGWFGLAVFTVFVVAGIRG